MVCCLTASRHYLIQCCWTVRYLRAISEEIRNSSITENYLPKIFILTFQVSKNSSDFAWSSRPLWLTWLTVVQFLVMGQQATVLSYLQVHWLTSSGIVHIDPWRVKFGPMHYNTMGLTHWGRDAIDAITQTTFSSAFYWKKMFEFRLKFHWSLFLRVQLTIFQHWFR